MPKLTKRFIDTLMPPPVGREAFAWDTQLKGFGVRLMPSGVGSYILKYRNREGRQRKLALGRIGTLAPEQARELAKLRLAEITQGADPSAVRNNLRTGITVTELCDLYLKDAEGRVKASTLAMDASRIRVHVKPLIGSKRVAALTSDDIERLQADILAGKSAAARTAGRGGKASGGAGVASRTVGMLGTILEFARRKKVIASNPARAVDRLPEGRQTRFLSLTEVGRLNSAMVALVQEGGNATGCAAIRFLLLTGCRRMEALALPLAWIDRKSSCIRFRDSKGIRAREVGGRLEIRPLGRGAFEVLDAVERVTGMNWAFPASRGNGHFVGLPKVLAAACSKAKLEGVTPHVLRHTFAATAAGLGYSELTIAGLLGHRIAGVTARYAHMPDAALVAAADKVAAEIAAAIGQLGDTRAAHQIAD